MSSTPRGTRLCRIGIWAAGIGLVLIAVSAGHKPGLIGWQPAFAALALGAVSMLIALLLAGLGLIRSRGSAGAASRPLTWLAFVAALVVTGVSLNGMRSADAPMIHDITTDTQNPPAFVDALARRQAAGALNPPEYSPNDAAVQAQAYPDLATIVIDAPADQVFTRVENTARAMGWEIIAAVPAEGRLEAIATTSWIGFRDDIVVRVAGAGAQTRVDVRSKSRVGRSDMGMNAKRIRAFGEKLLAG